MLAFETEGNIYMCLSELELIKNYTIILSFPPISRGVVHVLESELGDFVE